MEKPGKKAPCGVETKARFGALITVKRKDDGKTLVWFERVRRPRDTCAGPETWEPWCMVTYQDYREGIIPENYFHFLGYEAVWEATYLEFRDSYPTQVYRGRLYRPEEELQRIEEKLERRRTEAEHRLRQQIEEEVRKLLGGGGESR